MPRLNSSIIRRINTARVFHALRTHPGASQRRLCSLTRLDPSTVSAVIAGLVQDGVVRRLGVRRNGGAGRPEELLQIDPDGGVLIGASVERDGIDLLACGLDGCPRAGLRVDPATTVEEALATLRRGADVLLAELGANFSRVRGIGVGQHGLIDREGNLVLAPRLGWRNVRLGERLRAAFPVPVHVENDTKAAALGERLFGACREIDDFVVVHGGSGIGGALYLQGALYHGAGMAGEIGHTKVVPYGQLCGCGARGCLEAYVSEPAIRARLAERGVQIATMAQVARAAASDPVVGRVLHEAGELLGIALANLVNLLHPHRVVLAGSLATLASGLLPGARASLAAHALSKMGEQVEIIVSTLGDEAVPLGGVGLAMHGFLPAQLGIGTR